MKLVKRAEMQVSGPELGTKPLGNEAPVRINRRSFRSPKPMPREVAAPAAVSL
jgi:hypothetical protein